MPKIESYEKDVEKILRDYPETRNDDFKLFCKVVEVRALDPDSVTLKDFCENHNQYGIGSFETIRRVRQRIQESGKYEAEERTKDARREAEKDFLDYVRGR